MRRVDRPEAWLTSYVSPTGTPSSTLNTLQQLITDSIYTVADAMPTIPSEEWAQTLETDDGSTRKGIMIGLLSAFGSAAIVALILLIIWFFQYTQQGRIFLDRLGRPGEYDDEQAFAKEEAEALEEMDDMSRMEYLRAKAFVQANPPESVQTDISLSQFLAIQEKGVSAWEFEPELEIANCFVEGRTEVEFFDSECSVQSNLPVPKQNEVYYWESKIYDKPENTLISIGMSTKPYPLFRLPGWHKHSVAYTTAGERRHNQPFKGTAYGPEYVQGDVIGVGYRPRTGTIFFTRNGKKLDDVAHGLKAQNFFPTIGANGPCQIHVNFGQLGFVFIEANVKKWGLAPMTGSLAPPPPYGSEQGSILLEGGRDAREGSYIPASLQYYGHARTASQQFRLASRQPTSPGPQRSPTDISLAALSLVDSNEDWGEGTSTSAAPRVSSVAGNFPQTRIDFEPREAPPDYESPKTSPDRERRGTVGDYDDEDDDDDRNPLLSPNGPPIPSYEAAVRENQRGRSDTRGS